MRGLVYLAGPIDTARLGSIADVRIDRRSLCDLLRDLNVLIFCPANGFDAEAKHLDRTQAGPVLRRINRYVIDQATLMVVDFAYGFGFETLREVEYARSRGLPVVAYAPQTATRLPSAGGFDLIWAYSRDQLRDAVADVLHHALYQEETRTP